MHGCEVTLPDLPGSSTDETVNLWD